MSGDRRRDSSGQSSVRVSDAILRSRDEDQGVGRTLTHWRLWLLVDVDRRLLVAALAAIVFVARCSSACSVR